MLWRNLLIGYLVVSFPVMLFTPVWTTSGNFYVGLTILPILSVAGTMDYATGWSFWLAILLDLLGLPAWALMCALLLEIPLRCVEAVRWLAVRLWTALVD